MGGRRAGSLKNLVGSGGGVSVAKRRLSRAVLKEDPNAIASATVQLAADSDLGLQGLLYGFKLAPYINANASKLVKLSKEERDERIRQAWSKIKRRENITTSTELDNVVIAAAKEAFPKSGSSKK